VNLGFHPEAWMTNFVASCTLGQLVGMSLLETVYAYCKHCFHKY